MTLARFFTKLRCESGLTFRAAAAKAKPKIDPVTIWKIEAGRRVRAATLGQALRAIGVTEKDRAYVEAFAHWSTEEAKTLSHARIEGGMAKVRRGNQAQERFVNQASVALREIDAADRPLILEALRQPGALVLWVQSTRASRKK